MKLTTAHPPQPSAVDRVVDGYLSRDDGGLACMQDLFMGHPGPENYAAFGRIIRAGIEALGPVATRAALVATLRRRRGR